MLPVPVLLHLINIKKLGLDMEESYILIEPRVPSRGATVLLKALKESRTTGCPLKTVWNCFWVKPGILSNGFYLHVDLCMHLALFRNLCNNILACIAHKKREAKISNFSNISLDLGSKWPSSILLPAFLGFFNSMFVYMEECISSWVSQYLERIVNLLFFFHSCMC